MKKNSLKKNLTLICTLLFLSTLPQVSLATDYVQNPAENIDYYSVGMRNLEKRDYTSAIDNFKRALYKNPKDTSARNNLAVAYTSRGNYNYNNNINLESAANDYRTAIYYLKYYDKSSNTSTLNENINIAIKNLDSVLISQKFSTMPANRLKKAKELRGKGEFAASVIEYINAATDRTYAYESYAALGDVFLTLTNEYNAAVYYDKAMSINSSDPNLHLKFGKCLYDLGKIDAAVKELDIASENTKTQSEALGILETIWKKKISQNPKDAVAQMNLGAIYQNKKQYDLAMIQYKNAEALAPHNATLKLNMATLMQEKGNYAEALNMYNEILKTNPNNITVNIYKATTLDKLGKKDEAISIYTRLLQTNPNNQNVKGAMLDTITTLPTVSALTHLKKLSETMPNDTDVLYTYAYTLHKNKNYTEALTYYEKALAINNRNLDAYLNIANIYRQQNNTEKAITTLKTAQTLYPNNDKIMQTLNECEGDQKYSLIEKATRLYNNKDYNGAISIYKSITNPSEDVYLGIGACYQAMDKYDEAISNYQKAIKIDPSNPTTHYFLGLAYLYQKNYTKAETALKKAKELDDINPDIQDAYKSLKLAQSEEFMNIGVSLFENGKNDDAIINFNKAINLCSENGYAHYYRGLAYDTKGDSQKAINDYKKAVSLNPELSMAYYSMGLSYDALKNKAEAKKMYQQFLLEYTTQDDYYKYAKQRISEL